MALGSQKLDSQAKLLSHVDRAFGLDNLQRLQRWANTGGALDLLKEQVGGCVGEWLVEIGRGLGAGFARDRDLFFGIGFSRKIPIGFFRKNRDLPKKSRPAFAAEGKGPFPTENPHSFSSPKSPKTINRRRQRCSRCRRSLNICSSLDPAKND